MTTEATADTPPRPEFLAFGGFYKSELEPWLEAHEGRRRKARLLRWIIIAGGFALLAVGLYYVVTRDDESCLQALSAFRQLAGSLVEPVG